MKIQSSYEIQYSAGHFNHAASIANISDSLQLVSFYSGDAECHNSQRVVILLLENQAIIDSLELEPLTGNPIIIYNESLSAPQIIYSKFENLTAPRPKWWQYCSLWQREISIINESGKNKLELKNQKQILVKENDIDTNGIGYVAKSNPIYHQNNGWFLPLYREQPDNFYCVILHSFNAKTWNYFNTIKSKNAIIQPSCWFNNTNLELQKTANAFTPELDENIKIKLLARNYNPAVINKRRKYYAFYSESNDSGKTWSEPVETNDYLNYNNCIATLQIPEFKHPFIVWNDDPIGRKNLTLSYNNTKLIVLDNYGSYPCVTYSNDKLHVIYTAMPNLYKMPGSKMLIKHKQYDLEYLKSVK